MTKKELWNLFRITGKIDYYLKFKEIEKEDNMHLEEVEGIVTSETNYSETSKIINVITKEHGLIGVMAKGARSLKSPFRSVTSKLTYGKFIIYYKENKLSTLKEVSIINSLKI